MTEPSITGMAAQDGGTELLKYMGTDAQRWAQAFMKVVADRPAPEIDEGFMIGWFANAIETGRSAAMSSSEYVTSINEFALKANETAHKKGWWSNARQFDGVLMLIVSEASEALEEWRNNHKEDEGYWSLPKYRPAIEALPEGLRETAATIEEMPDDGIDIVDENFNQDEIQALAMEGFLKPEGIPSELADIVIRVMDCAVEYGIDLEDEITLKMAYNATRPHKHGGKRS
jgi:NTP pyrophosphatase (non-canonical NTP hydrolase)